jgi:hypothetical protein
MNKTITKKQSRYKKEDYQALADCIRSDQLSAKQVHETMVFNPDFAKWYRMKYLVRK